jgi:hypothetical protein
MKIRALIPAIFFAIHCYTTGLCQVVPISDSTNPGYKVMPEMDTLPLFINKSNWLVKFDIDGDGVTDTVSFDYTGGVHCCYRIHIKLSNDKIERKFPFELDGGYLAGVDSTLPEQFNISDIDTDGMPEIFIKIQTYNGMLYPIPKKWKRLYGIKTNTIIIKYEKNRLVVRDR